MGEDASTIRTACPADLPAIQAILNAPDNLDKLAAYDDSTLVAAMTDPDHRILVLDEGGGTAGFVRVTAFASDNGPKIEEFGATEPGRGYGSRLLSDVLERLWDAGHRQIRLDVAGDNVSAIAFYRCFGVVDGETRRQARQRRLGPIADAVTMMQSL